VGEFLRIQLQAVGVCCDTDGQYQEKIWQKKKKAIINWLSVTGCLLCLKHGGIVQDLQNILLHSNFWFVSFVAL